MRNVEAVIFDWAGTTVDYGCFAPVQAFVEVFKHFGIEPTMQEVREPMGMLKIDHIRTMLHMPRIQKLWEEKYGQASTEEDVEKLYGLFEEKLMSILDRFAQPKPYVLEVVKELRARGIKIGSTTGYTDDMMAVVVPKAKEAGYEPDTWFSPDSVGHVGRPYPYMIFQNMEALHVSSVEHVVKVGDTVSDILEGKHAGVFTVGVVEGSSEMGLTEEEYEQARASVNSAFYTPPVVAKVIYKALQQFGFEGGSILEPSMGIGNFYSVLPEDMRNSQLYGVELDSISGRIAKQLHQSRFRRRCFRRAGGKTGGNPGKRRRMPACTLCSYICGCQCHSG